MQNDEALVQQYQSGNTDAFGELYDRYIRKIYDFVYYRVTHRETAEDLTSQTFIKALENLGSFRTNAGTFKAWLYRIARNTLIDHYRKTGRTAALDEVYDMPDPKDASDAAAVKHDLQRAEEYLRLLPDEHRELIMLRVYDNLSYKEIAEITGRTEAGLRVSFSRLITALRKELIIALVICSQIVSNLHG